MKIAVGVDGSTESLRAYFAAAAAFQNAYGSGAELFVVHVYNEKKDGFLPFDMRSQSVKAFYSAKLTSFSNSRTKFIMVPQGEADTRTALMDTIRLIAPDLLFVGIVGRKGPKEQPTLLGKTSDYSLRSAHTSTAIVRTGSVKTGEAVTFVVGVDGSQRSHQAMMLAQSIAGKGDSIEVVHILDKNAQAVVSTPRADTSDLKRFDDAAIEEKYAAYCAEMNGKSGPVVTVEGGGSISGALSRGYTMKYVQKSRVEGEGISTALIRASDEAGAHYLVVGIDGAYAFVHKGSSKEGSVIVGSVSDDVVKKATSANVICVCPTSFL